jgi:YbbR domain-containing protein
MQFLVALIAAFLLWYALAAQRSEDISVRGVKALVSVVNIPRDLVLTSPVPDTVSLQLRGPLSTLSNLDPRKPPEVLLDLSDALPGLNSYLINASDIPLPTEVEVVNVDPKGITLELERQETRQVLVRPVVIGVPAPGFVVREVRASPAQYTVQPDFYRGRVRTGGGHGRTAPTGSVAARDRRRSDPGDRRHRPGGCR